MIMMTRIQGHSMGFSNYQKPILQSPRMGGIFQANLNLPLAAGSLSGGGGADGGGAAPAPAPAPGAVAPASPQDVVQNFYPPQQTYVVAQQPPAPATPEAFQGLPTWAIVGGALLAGVVLAKLL